MRKCNDAQYVGQTKNSLRDRFYLHRSHIEKKVNNPLSNHFNSNGHNVEYFGSMVIERVFGKILNKRLKRESFWIKKSKNLVPHGLNKDP